MRVWLILPSELPVLELEEREREREREREIALFYLMHTNLPSLFGATNEKGLAIVSSNANESPEEDPGEANKSALTR